MSPRAVANRVFAAAVRAGLAAQADPERAAANQAYMKSAMPYYGVRLPEVRRLVKDLDAAHPMTDRAEWEATIRLLYDDAGRREERYAALALAALRRYGAFATDLAALPLYEHLIRAGAWWDLVDETSHRVGDVLRVHRSEATPFVLAWSTADHLWVRRSSIICQVGHRAATDVDLLGAVIEPNIADRDFFIRKAIGWALRDLSATKPTWVRAFVAAHPDLAPLSRREALRRLPPAVNDSQPARQPGA